MNWILPRALRIAAILALGTGALSRTTAAGDEMPDGLSANDWAGIRAAYEAGRHAVHPVAGGYRARNLGQRWHTTFDGRGFLAEPDAGGWAWGLELVRYGFAGGTREVTAPERVSALGERVTYAWDETIEEWYVNDRRGLEHGYTVDRRPASGRESERGPLTLILAVRGTLHPEVKAGGRDVHFRNREDELLLTYSGLRVIDAEGRELEASFECVSEGLRLSIDERGARYPILIDPVAQQAYLKASNTDPGDVFGTSVAMSGDTAVIGAPGESSDAPGVNGDQSSNGLYQSGAAYVFVQEGTTWSQQAYLKPSLPDWGDRFGHSVSISGDTIVIGAPEESSSATGVNGNQSDNSALSAGAAYVFAREGTTWSEQAYLKASNTDPHDQLGGAVAVSGDTVVVGAKNEGSASNGVNGYQFDNSLGAAGAGYVFVRSGDTWSQQAYLKASNPDSGDRFGCSVSISNDEVVVGAWGESSQSAGVNGHQLNDSAPYAGAAYVFRRYGGSWIQQAYLKASNPDLYDHFGAAVAISNTTIVVGAPRESSAATGVNGDQSDNSSPWAGAAYVFIRGAATSWGQEAYLKASNAGTYDEFGSTVAASGEVVLVGARNERSQATGVDGNQGDDSAPQSGAAYVFRCAGRLWSQFAYLKASNTDSFDYFGNSVAVSGEVALVGAPFEGSRATGVNGDESSNLSAQAGAAYLFHLDLPQPAVCSHYCGSGVNMDTYVVWSGYVIAGAFQGSVGYPSPNIGAVIAGYLGTQTFPLWGGEGLVDPTTPEVMGLPLGIGPSPAVITWYVPNDPTYAGYHLYTQAAAFGGGVINLTCAYDCTVGY